MEARRDNDHDAGGGPEAAPRYPVARDASRVAEDEIEAAGEMETLYLNGAELQKLLAGAGVETADFTVKSTEDPILVKAPTWPEWTGIIMPMRG